MTETIYKLQAESLLVQWQDGAESVLPYLWLRDNCGCDDCRISQTSEKQFMLSSVPVDLTPAEVQLNDDLLSINWPDTHSTEFSGEALRRLNKVEESSWQSWSVGFTPEKFSFTKFLNDDDHALDAINQFLRDGVMIIADSPTKSHSIEQLTPRLGPIREMLFERIHNVRFDPSGYNVAHTSFQLPPHNDFASMSWPPTIQALHMLENEAEKGESIIVDSRAVLEQYRKDQPEYFDCLCRVPVPFRMFDEDNETYAVQPLVRCDAQGKIVSVRYSNQLMQTINPNNKDVVLFYKAYHELCRRINDPEIKVTFRLEGGQILLVAAHRVLHAREAFEPTGARHLQDAYFELDNMKNHRVVIQNRREKGV